MSEARRQFQLLSLFVAKVGEFVLNPEFHPLESRNPVRVQKRTRQFLGKHLFNLRVFGR